MAFSLGIILLLVIPAYCTYLGNELPLEGAPTACPELGVFAYPHEQACDQFYLCVNGTFSHETCPNGLAFAADGKVVEFCTYPWHVNCGDKILPDPIPSENCPWQFGLFPFGAECNTQYFKCAWGIAHVTDCEEGLVYDDTKKACNWPDVLGCNSEAVVGFTCPAEPTGKAALFNPTPRYPHPYDCTKLIICVEGNPRILNCGDGKAFSEEEYGCVDNRLVNCKTH